MTPKQVRGERTAEALLDAALAVHEQAGRAGLTVQAVGAESGVSLGSLYHHFGSLDGLAAALYSRCMGELLDALIEALAASRGARGGVRAIVTAYLRFALEHPGAAGVIHGVATGPGFATDDAAAIARDKAPRMDAMLDWLAPHVAAGRIVDLPAPLVEVLLIGPPAETVRRWLGGQPGVDPRAAMRVLPERVWRSLAGDAA